MAMVARPDVSLELPNMSLSLRAPQRRGVVHILSTRNNILVTLTEEGGRTLVQCSAGSLGFRHSRKSTPYAAQRVMEEVVQRALQRQVRQVRVEVRGLGYGKESSLRVLAKSPLQITHLQECTPTAHNGCRRPRRRRL